MNELLDSIFPAGAFFIIGFFIAAGWSTFQYISKVTKDYFKTSYEDGYNFIIIEGTENTKYPKKYSEGVFAWYEDDELKISEEYQIKNGGDPMVFKKYLLQSNINNKK